MQLVLILNSLLATLRGVNTAFFFPTNMPRLTNNSLAGLGFNSDVPLPVSTAITTVPSSVVGGTGSFAENRPLNPHGSSCEMCSHVSSVGKGGSTTGGAGGALSTAHDDINS